MTEDERAPNGAPWAEVSTALNLSRLFQLVEHGELREEDLQPCWICPSCTETKRIGGARLSKYARICCACGQQIPHGATAWWVGTSNTPGNQFYKEQIKNVLPGHEANHLALAKHGQRVMPSIPRRNPEFQAAQGVMKLLGIQLI